MKYFDEINTSYVADRIVSCTVVGSRDSDALRRQADGRSHTYENMTPENIRQDILRQVVGSWFNDWFWRTVLEVMDYAKTNPDLYMSSSERDANWLFAHIVKHYTVLANEAQLTQLHDKLAEVMPGTVYVIDEIGAFLADIATETYARGVVGAKPKEGKGLVVRYIPAELRHTYRPVNEPWY